MIEKVELKPTSPKRNNDDTPVITDITEKETCQVGQ